MAYKINYTKQFEKDFSKLSKEIQKIIINKYLPVLEVNPQYGKRIKRKNLCLWRFKFRYKRNDYRIIYKLFNHKLLIVLIAVGSRENFYKNLKVKRLL